MLRRMATSATASPATFSRQSALPRLPIPKLEDTISKYLKSLEPIATRDELETTKQLAADFAGGLGKKLQDRLTEYDRRQKHSWLEDIWLDRAYLSFREPLMINVNWYMVFKKPNNYGVRGRKIVDTLPYTEDQLKRAAVLAKLACDYKGLLDTEQLPIDMAKGNEPLCMHQITKMFGVTRIPDQPSDKLISEHPAKGKTAMVLVDEQVFIVPVVDQSIQSIYSNLLSCVHQLALLAKRSPPVPILTSQNRDIWAVQFKKIWQLNRPQLEEITSALFAICLDSPSPKDDHEAAAIALHGKSGKNRWFDKCIEFFVCPNGVAGCNGEHSPCDAVIPNQMTTYILQQYAKHIE